MAARWDFANAWENGNDHGMFSNGDEPGVPKWNARPAFYHMYYFQKFLGDRLVASTSDNPDLISYASSFTSGQVGVTLVNKSNASQDVQVKFQNSRVIVCQNFFERVDVIVPSLPRFLFNQLVDARDENIRKILA